MVVTITHWFNAKVVMMVLPWLKINFSVVLILDFITWKLKNALNKQIHQQYTKVVLIGMSSLYFVRNAIVKVIIYHHQRTLSILYVVIMTNTWMKKQVNVQILTKIPTLSVLKCQKEIVRHANKITN